MAEEKSKPIPDWINKLKEDKELQRQQERLNKENKWRLVNTRDDAIIFYAEREVELARRNLEIFKDQKMIRDEKRRLAENLITLGEFAEAKDVSPDEDLKELAESLHKAITKNDTEKCSCEDLEINGKMVDRYHVLMRIKSPTHGKIIPVMRCSQCGTINASPNIHAEG
jgi:hypothetical protein